MAEDENQSRLLFDFDFENFLIPNLQKELDSIHAQTFSGLYIKNIWNGESERVLSAFSLLDGKVTNIYITCEMT